MKRFVTTACVTTLAALLTTCGLSSRASLERMVDQINAQCPMAEHAYSIDSAKVGSRQVEFHATFLNPEASFDRQNIHHDRLRESVISNLKINENLHEMVGLAAECQMGFVLVLHTQSADTLQIVIDHTQLAHIFD